MRLRLFYSAKNPVETMKTYKYKMKFAPYSSALKAKNKKEAMAKIQKMWPNYNLKKCLQYLQKQ